jgi:alpha-galactosidase
MPILTNMPGMNLSTRALLTALLLAWSAPTRAADIAQADRTAQTISIATANFGITLQLGSDGRLYQIASGRPLATPARATGKLDRETEFFPPFGDGFISEPAVQATHGDGNNSTDLIYVTNETTAIDANVSLTRIELKDRFYPFFATLCFKAYHDQDVLEEWSEFRHDEEGRVTLFRFASSSTVAQSDKYFLTQLHGDWASEATMEEEKLGTGITILDSKIGVRAGRYRTPSFFLSLHGPAQEESGEVYAGSLEWSGSFQFDFDVDWLGQLRILSGINPFASQYPLGHGEVFKTPAMLWTWSNAGKGQASRNLHRWARRYGVRDAAQRRPIVLNNWEATGFNFTESRIVSLFDGAKELGADLFLLDDGWFANKCPRNSDHAGLGDWDVNTNKLPHGLSFLADEAKKRDIRFGIWLEPEMVNPKSELYEQHPEWAIAEPHRAPEVSRNQLNLDLARPEVREFSWHVIDRTLGSNPGISYLKWDANRYVTQPGSTYLKPDEQSRLLIDYNFALYDIMGRMASNYPNVTAMLCSGGAGRADYGALKYFHTFWPSDNTDPLDRVFIQWGFSQFFPSCAMSDHVTKTGRRPFKFTLDVALSGVLGLDLDVDKMTAAERQAASAAINLYKKSLCDIVFQGDLYRLDSPYEGPRSAISYVTPDHDRAAVFIYQIKDAADQPVKLRGLDPAAKYIVREVNLLEGTASNIPDDGKTIEGASLMGNGLASSCQKQFESAVIELRRQ